MACGQALHGFAIARRRQIRSLDKMSIATLTHQSTSQARIRSEIGNGTIGNALKGCPRIQRNTFCGDRSKLSPRQRIGSERDTTVSQKIGGAQVPVPYLPACIQGGRGAAHARQASFDEPSDVGIGRISLRAQQPDDTSQNLSCGIGKISGLWLLCRKREDALQRPEAINISASRIASQGIFIRMMGGLATPRASGTGQFVLSLAEAV